MGAYAFEQEAEGQTPAIAFRRAIEKARYDHGNAGYTGTVAEKSEFTLLKLPEGEEPLAYARKLMEADDPRVCDKWGPAGSLPLGKNRWLFFGWASS